jgi:predicted DNA-binding transcriptional regulator AlpA
MLEVQTFDVEGVLSLLHISRRTLSNLIEKKQFPRPARAGRRMLWRSIDIDEWLAAGGSDAPARRGPGRPRKNGGEK